ncbi:MAG: histidine phosphatase family protein [Polyangiaceae bacterium]
MRRLVYLARHGETDWNDAGRWQGHTDVPLNDVGRGQARTLATRLRGASLAAVVTSDLSRAAETGRIVATELGVTVAYADHALRERSFGVFEGLTREECETQHVGAWQAWLDRKVAPEGGETQEALTVRMMVAVERVATAIARPGAPALVVTHGGALRAVVCAVTGTMPAPVKNGSLWTLTWDGRITTAEAIPG